MTKDYKIEIKVKNNLLHKAMLENGYENVAQLARACNYSQVSIANALSLKIPLYNKHGKIYNIWLILSDALKRLPEDLIPKQHHNVKLEKNKSTFEADFVEVGYLMPPKNPETLVIQHQSNDVLKTLVKRLPDRHAEIIKKRYGIDCEPRSIDELALEYGISRSRINQIENNALRKMRGRAKKHKQQLIGLYE